MTTPFRLTSERLILRPFALSDAPDVQRLAGAFAIADTTRVVPHPYLDGMAENWIATHEPPSDVALQLELATVEKETHALVGAVSLVAISHQDSRAEMGYWIGECYWGKGYCTEAARVLLDHAFGHLALNRVCARYLKRNGASGRVLEKIGMREEGCLRQENKKWDTFEDVVVCGILRSEWETLTTPADDSAN
jgi:RimJ/RimL family protein N-acetyltransferase